MGIQGLLPLLSSIQKYAHLRDFAGQVLGVDAYGWLHRGTFTCATELAQGKPCRAYVDFALSRVRMLQHFGVTPYLVFDGGRLPSKAATEKDRSERRKEGRRKGLAYMEAGKSALAYQELQKSIDVTPQMARNLIEELKNAGVKYVVAPYEADSQLVYLEKQGVISGILSEDSDLLVFGAEVLVTKLDQFGECVVYRKADFTKCKEISLVNWSGDDFRMMAILSGCDYLPGIPGVGLKSAYRLVRQHKTVEKIVRMLQFDGKKKVPAGYLDAFRDAERTFLHQWVYCPTIKGLVNLTPLPKSLDEAELPYIGSRVPDALAAGVANGDLHPSSKESLRSTLKATVWKKPSHALQQTPDLKEGRSIAEFFKPVRTPLAELDPNAFTPSPSQRRLLDAQQGRSWSARSTPTNRTDAGSIRSAMRASTTSLSSTMSAETQTKRTKQRLCADTEAGMHTDSGASPYFSGEQSGVKLRTKQKGDGFELYSDDSICEALESTAKAAEEVIAISQRSANTKTPKKRKHFDIFNDAIEQRNSQSSLSTTQTSRSASFSSMGRSQITTMTSMTSGSMSSFMHTSQAEDSLLIQQSKRGLLDLKMPLKQSLSPKQQCGSVTQTDELAIEAATTPTDNESPEEGRDEGQVLCSSPSDTTTGQQSEVEEAEQDCTVRRDSIEHSELPQSIPITAACNKVGAPLGSEDFLIPQSPGSVTGDDDAFRARLDLGSFMFGR